MKLEHRLMDGLGRFVIRYRKVIPIVGVVAVVLSLAAANQIVVKTQIKDLLPEDNPMIASWDAIMDEFDGGESIFVMVTGADKDVMADGARLFAEEFESRPEAMQYVTAINLETDTDFVRNWGLLLQESDDLERTLTMLEETNLLPLIRSLNDNFETTYSSDTAEEELSNTKQENDTVVLYQQMETFFTALTEHLENPEAMPADQRGRELAELFLLGDSFSYAWDNSMLVFTIVPGISSMDFAELVALMDNVREVQAIVEAQVPGVTVQVTGNIPIQADEQLAMGFDMLVPALVALLLILVVFLFSFDQIRSIVMTLIVLVMGIIFNYGFVGVTIREINMMTSFMSTLLIGLGIDYGIQIVTTFNAMRKLGHDPNKSIMLTFRKAGMGTLLAAFTTAVAFIVMTLTGSKAFAQFGVTAASGIVLCFLAMVTILPSLLLLFGRKQADKEARLPKIDYSFLGSFAEWAGKHRLGVLVVGAVMSGALAFAALGMRVEYNFMNLEPQDMPSIVAYNDLSERLGITPSQTMVIADSIEQAHELTDRLEEEPLIADVRSIAYLIPRRSDARERLEIVTRSRDAVGRTTELDYGGATLEDLLYEIQRVEWNLIEIADLSVAGLGEDNRILRKRNAMVREIFGAEVGEAGDEVFQTLITLIESDPQRYGALLSELDTAFAAETSAIARDMVAVDRPIGIGDLPENYRDGFLSGTGERNLVTAFPAEGMYESLPLMERFTEDMQQIDDRMTGSVQLGLEWTRESFRSSIRAGIFILIVVVAALLIEFRSIRWAAAAAFPLVFGMVWMLGLYPALGMKINPINLAMVPLVIGMAVDFGIHLVHRYREERDLRVTYSYTGKAVLLSAFTTMIGFGSLALVGEFKSLSLIGAILFLGIASAFVVSLVFLPAVLAERPRANRTRADLEVGGGRGNNGRRGRQTADTGAARIGNRTVGGVRCSVERLVAGPGAVLALAIVVLAVAAGTAGAQDATEIMRRVSDEQDADTAAMRISMHIYDSLESDESRDLFIESYGRGDTENYMEFVAPRSIAGLRVQDLDGEIRVFFPSTGRVRRIASGQKSGSVGGVGGDFSYEDMGGGELLDDYTFSMVDETPAAWVIRGIPTDPDSSYNHLIYTIDRERLVATRIEYFTEDHGREKTLTAETFQTIQGRLIATELTMMNHRRHRRTQLVIHQAAFDVPMDDRFFNPNRFYR